MKKILLISTLTLLIACNSNKSPELKSHIIPTRSCKIVDGYSVSENLGKNAVIANSQSKDCNNISAITEDWLVNCENDMITDKRKCRMSRFDKKYGTELVQALIILNSEKGNVLCIGEEHFPNKSSQIRIDNNTPFTTSDKDGCFSYKPSKNIINQLLSGQEIKIRFYQWPYDGYKDIKFLTSGFSQSLKTMNDLSKSNNL